MGTATHSTDADFKKDVLDSKIPVLVDFWAEWCGPCRMMTPVLEQLAGEQAGKLKVVKVNVDENQGVSNDFQIRAMPTFLLFKDGRVVKQMVGARTKLNLEKEVETFLS